MDRGKWDKMLTCFQAYARGYLVRKEIRRAGEDFEEIVNEIDGSLSHLEWSETVIPIPHFTDAGGPFLRPSSSTRKPSKAGPDDRTSSQSPSALAPSLEERRGSLLENIEAERDDSPSKGHASLSKDCLGQKESSVVDKDGEVMESTGDSTSVWSSLELDMNYGHCHKGSQRYHLAQEVPCTPEALRLHRNTLTMELLWLQQAIDSRKKYLTLKDRLSVS
uniref:IQ domain-containing protein C n=1 Tax=Scatophagus argus TaxID=75038 RepID=UPI001ED8413B|nr:IQ domain-containing protein C [Scatophagus argus]